MKEHGNHELEKLVEILKSFTTCMLVSYGRDGEMLSRPMTIARVDPDLKLWFMASIQSDQVGEFLNDSHASITAQNDHSAYLSISGRAHAIQNSAIARELWNSGFDIWFPKGPTDPALALIEFQPSRGEYWDSRGTRKISYAVEMVKAYVSGKSPDLESSEYHGKVRLDSTGRI